MARGRGDDGAGRRGRVELALRLRSRTEEIEEEIFATIEALPATDAAETPEYVTGLRAAVVEVVELALSAIERDQGAERLTPISAVAQAKRAARAGIGVDTVMRRYAAGDRALCLLLAEESREFPSEVLREAQRALSATVDRLMAIAADEHALESARLPDAPRDPVLEQARRILLGEISPSDLAGYVLDLWHVALVGEAEIRPEVLRAVARETECQLLILRGELDHTWAWMGRREGLDADLVMKVLAEVTADRRSPPLVLGEARLGIDGWRLSHEEARAALGAPSAAGTPVLRARAVALAMAVVNDPVLRASFFASYVEPLDRGRQGTGAELRQTLLSYLEVGQSIKPVSALLGIDRHTVKRRLRASEGLIGRSIEDCAPELQTALRAAQMLSGADEPRPSRAAG